VTSGPTESKVAVQCQVLSVVGAVLFVAKVDIVSAEQSWADCPGVGVSVQLSKGHVWFPSDMEMIFCFEHRTTDSSTPRFPGLPGLCLRLPSSRQCLNPRPTRHRIEHLTSASKGIRHPDVGNLKQYCELVQRIVQGRSDLAISRMSGNDFF
jgi:hypothetical protein